MITALFFYLFALMTTLAGLMVISARNPVHAVLFLILAFFNSAGLLILLGAEFLAMLLVVVYVGAVAVLFLFVVMMLDINIDELRAGFLRHLPLGLLVGGILITELLLAFTYDLGGTPATTLASDPTSNLASDPASGFVALPAEVVSRSNTAMIGDRLYTEYLLNFQVAGLILLVAMIGAIALTMREVGKQHTTKRQSIAQQNLRRRSETVAVVSVESGEAPKPLPTAITAQHARLAGSGNSNGTGGNGSGSGGGDSQTTPPPKAHNRIQK